MTKFHKNSLAFRINLIGLVLAALLFLFFGANLYLTGQSMERLERAKVTAALRTQISTLEDAVFFDFDRPIEEIMRHLLDQNRAIEEIVLQLKGRKRIFKPVKPVPTVGKEFVETIPLKHGNVNLGTLKIRYRTLYAAHYFQRYLARLLIVVIVVILSLLSIAYYVNRNLERLTHFAERLRALDPMKVTNVNPEAPLYEFKYIADAVNNMLKRIQEYAGSLKELNLKLKANERKLMRAQRIAKMISWSYYPETMKIEVTYEFFRLFEIKKKDSGPLSLKEVIRYIHPDDREIFIQILKESVFEGKKFEFVHKVVTSRGKIRYMRTEGRVNKSKHKDTEVIGISMDVTDEVEAKQQADFMALYDPLTGLLNRRSLQENLEYILRVSDRYNHRAALLFIDLDNFKAINDSYGHETGDQLLIHIAKILKEFTRESDLVSRIGGDEFIIVLTDIKDRHSVEDFAKKLLEKLASTYWINSHQFTLTSSMGAAIYPDDGQDVDGLMRFSDAAMYEAKRAGKNRFVLFDEKIRKKIEERRDIVGDLKKALTVRDQIVLYFQPQIDLCSGEVIGAEVLTRWHHPTRGIIFPGEYIPLIEGTALMNRYDDYVLQMAFKQLQLWNDRYGKRWKLGINLSAGQFSSRRLIENLEEYVHRFRIDPDQIDLEITESLPMQDIATAIGTLQSIKALGFSISIDDFGTGYSSLSYLQKLPFDIIKIDREFVKDMHRIEDSRAIVNLMIQMGKTLGKKTIAEGPDIKEHIAILKELGCDYAQGFYYSKAVPEEAFVEFAMKRVER